MRAREAIELETAPPLLGDEWNAPLFFLVLWIQWCRYLYAVDRAIDDRLDQGWIDLGGEG